MTHAQFLKELRGALSAKHDRRIWSREEELVWAAAAQKFRNEEGRLPDPRKPAELARVERDFTQWRNRLFDLADKDPRVNPGNPRPTAAEEKEFVALKRTVTALAAAYDREQGAGTRRAAAAAGLIRISPRREPDPVVPPPEAVLPRREPAPRGSERRDPAVEPIRTKVPERTLVDVAAGIYRGQHPDDSFARSAMSGKLSTSTDRAFLARTGARNQGDVQAQIDDVRAFGAECRTSRQRMLLSEPRAFADFRKAYLRENGGTSPDFPSGDNPAKWSLTVRKSQAYRDFYTTMIGIRREYADTVGASLRSRGYAGDTKALEQQMGLPARP